MEKDNPERRQRRKRKASAIPEDRGGVCRLSLQLPCYRLARKPVADSERTFSGMGSAAAGAGASAKVLLPLTVTS